MEPRYIDANKIPYFKTWNPEIEGKLLAGMAWKDDIDSIPTADVKPVVHGEWILHQDSKTWECSECHKYQVIWSNFCQYCGADMRGQKDGEKLD